MKGEPTPPGTLGVLRLLATATVRRWARAFHIAQAARSAKRSHGKTKRGGKLVALFVLLLPFLFFQPLLLSTQSILGLLDATSRQTDDQRIPISPFLYEALRSASERGNTESSALRSRLERRYDSADYDLDQVVRHLQQHGIGGFRALERNQFWVDPAQWPPPGPQRERVLGGLAMLALMLCTALLLAAIGANPQLGRGEWTLTWLLGFPVATRAVASARALEYGVVQLTPWLTFFPFLIVAHFAAGHGLMGIAWSALATLCVGMMIGAARLVGETWLRLNLGVHRIRSIQGMSALLMTLLFFAVVAGSAQRPVARWFTDLLLAAPAALRNLPIAWPVTLIDRPAVALALCAVVALAATGLAIEATTWMLRHGTTRSEGAAPRARGGARWTKPGESRGLWRGVLGKDLRLLLRDRNFLVSTLIVPVVMIALQLFLNRRMGTRLGRSSGQWDATAAYVVGSYALTTGCFRILSGEGRSLWLLFAQPIEVARALRHKVRLWLGLGLLFGLGTLTALSAMHGVTDVWRLASDVAFVGVGIWLAGHLAGGIAALAANPATDHIKPGVGARFAYLYLFLAGTYTAGLQSSALTARITAFVVFGTMVAALWFRIRERMPYLLDPEAPPDRNLSLYDAALAALTFFIVQVLAAMVLHFSAGRSAIDPLGLALRAFATAGVVTLTLFSLVLKLRGIALRDAFALRLPSWGRAVSGVVVGAVAGAALGCGGLAWAELAQEQGWLDVSTPPETTSEQRNYLLWLGVVAAPLCEEALFRGMLFQSMATVLRTPIAAVWSAAVFAACHPPAAWPPVFSLGVLAALLLARTRFLPAAIAAHAAYNAVVLLQPWA